MKKNRVGDVYLNNQGYSITILEDNGYHKLTVQFNDGVIINCELSQLVKGTLANRNYKTLYGIGYYGYGNYSTVHNGKNTKSYNVWRGMITRCYSGRYIAYSNCKVCEEWHNFQVFSDWFEKNYIDGYQLDKDIKFKGNKLYSPDTCSFVPQEINNTFLLNKNKRGNLPIGICLYHGKYLVQLCTNKRKHRKIGSFDTPEEAFYCYKIAKEAEIKRLANKYKETITAECYKAMMEYVVEITD
jgi:hypothetical protein